MTRFEAPRGTHDILPSEQPLWEWVTGEMKDVASLYGYRRIDTPGFEDAPRARDAGGVGGSKLPWSADGGGMIRWVGSAGGLAAGVFHQCAQVVSAQVDFVRQRKLRRDEECVQEHKHPDCGQLCDEQHRRARAHHDLHLSRRGTTRLPRGIRQLPVDRLAPDVRVFAPQPDGSAVTFQQGMNITMVTTAGTDEEAKALLAQLGVPFRES